LALWALAPARAALIKPRPLLPALGVLAGLATIGATNYAQTGALFLNRSGSGFLAARLIQDGVVKKLLDDTCPGSGYSICPYRDQLPKTANEWLWQPASPFKSLGGFEGTEQENARIVSDSLRRYPWWNFKLACFASWRQFYYVKTVNRGAEPHAYVQLQMAAVLPMVQQYLPGQVQDYLAARQQRDELSFQVLTWVDWVVTALSFALGAALGLQALIRRRGEDWALLAFVLVALVGNAVICGTVSGPHDRYQSRTVWLTTYAALLLLARAPALSFVRSSPAARLDPA
jgi:hypothetical protein